MKKLFSFIYFFVLSIVPRLGPIDLVIIFSFIIIIYSFFMRGCLEVSPIFKPSFGILCLLIPIVLVSFVLYADAFGMIRFFKVILLFSIVAPAIRFIGEELTHKYFPLFLLLSILILYFEYINIYGSQAFIRELQNVMHSGREVSYRAKGLFAGYSAAGVSCGFISLYALYYTLYGKINFYIGFSLFCLSSVATFFTGRTGIIVFIISFAIMFFLKFDLIFKHSRKIIFVLLLFVVPLFSFIYYSLDLEVFEITVIRTFEIIFNYYDSGTINSESTTQLANTLTLPSKFEEVLFGNGLEPWSSNAINIGAHQTDSGLVQTLFMYGLFGFLIYYGPVFYIFLVSCRFIYRGNFKLSYLLISIPLGLLAEVKGHYIYSILIFILIFMPAFFYSNSLRDKLE